MACIVAAVEQGVYSDVFVYDRVKMQVNLQFIAILIEG